MICYYVKLLDENGSELYGTEISLIDSFPQVINYSLALNRIYGVEIGTLDNCTPPFRFLITYKGMNLIIKDILNDKEYPYNQLEELLNSVKNK